MHFVSLLIMLIGADSTRWFIILQGQTRLHGYAYQCDEVCAHFNTLISLASHTVSKALAMQHALLRFH